MTDVTPPGPPPGWLYDRSTGQTRWWDGTRWTEHVQRPPAPTAVFGGPTGYVTGPAGYGDGLTPLPKTNGYARTATVLLGLVIVGFAAVPLLFGLNNPAMVALSGFLTLALTVSGLAFAIAGTVVAVRRPTKKYEAVVAVVIGSLMLAWILGVMIFTAIQSATTLEASSVEAQIADWASSKSGDNFRANCPTELPGAEGSHFTCVATSDSGTAWNIQVTVNSRTLSLQVVE